MFIRFFLKKITPRLSENIGEFILFGAGIVRLWGGRWVVGQKDMQV